MIFLNPLIFLWLCLFAFAAPQIALAETAEEVARAIIFRAQRERDFSLVFEHIHWSASFEELTPDQRERLLATSPSELERVVRQGYDDPVGLIREVAIKNMAVNGGFKKTTPEEFKKDLERISSEIERGQAEKLENFYRAQCAITSESVRPSYAVLQLSCLYPKEKKESVVLMEKVGSEWQFTSIRWLDRLFNPPEEKDDIPPWMK